MHNITVEQACNKAEQFKKKLVEEKGAFMKREELTLEEKLGEYFVLDQLDHVFAVNANATAGQKNTSAALAAIIKSSCTGKQTLSHLVDQVRRSRPDLANDATLQITNGHFGPGYLRHGVTWLVNRVQGHAWTLESALAEHATLNDLLSTVDEHKQATIKQQVLKASKEVKSTFTSFQSFCKAASVFVEKLDVPTKFPDLFPICGALHLVKDRTLTHFVTGDYIWLVLGLLDPVGPPVQIKTCIAVHDARERARRAAEQRYILLAEGVNAMGNTFMRAFELAKSCDSLAARIRTSIEAGNFSVNELQGDLFLTREAFNQAQKLFLDFVRLFKGKYFDSDDAPVSLMHVYKSEEMNSLDRYLKNFTIVH